VVAYLLGTVALVLLCLAHVPFPLVFLSMMLVTAAALFNVAVVSLLVLAVSLCCTVALATGLWVTPPVTAQWQEMWVYLGIAAALVPAQLLAATIAEVRAGHGELERRQAELARTNEALESFVRIASHDLREPLNTVVQFSTLIQLEAAEGRPLGREPLAWLGHVVTAGERMRVLLDDLLRYLRAEHDLAPAAGDRPAQAVLALDRVLADAAAALAARLRDTGADLRVEPLPMVMGNHTALVLLFQNLLSNALKFVPPGRTPQVRVRAAPPADEADGLVRIEVHDNGIGIAESELPRLFKPFVRLVPRRHYDGTGLGLALARDIAVHHGGDIAVRSQPGQGSVFVVQLRAAPAGVSAP
jgi:signal transduction histidine kinase